MTSLNSRMQLALINRKKGRNLLEKGFTLVELMIVIVIVGILSSVALPNFLSQQNKARATEGTQTLSTILKAAYADYQQDLEPADARSAAEATIASANKDNFDYGTPTLEDVAADPDATPPTQETSLLRVLATGTNDLASEGNLGGCVNLGNGTVRITKTLDPSLAVADIPCA